MKILDLLKLTPFEKSKGIWLSDTNGGEEYKEWFILTERLYKHRIWKGNTLISGWIYKEEK